jgi:hypothetical protein
MFPQLIFSRSRKINKSRSSFRTKPDSRCLHVISVLRLVKQKGAAAEVKEAFAALVAVRKEMSPFFNFPEDKTVAAKEARKKKLNKLDKSLKAKKTIAVKLAQKAYELFRCFVVGKAQMQWDRIANEMHTKNLWIGVNGKSNKGNHGIASSSTSSPSSLLMQLKNSVTTCSRQSRSPSKSWCLNLCHAWAS